ncbi:Rod shape-determining protein RodA [Helicobacter heilmannii]|uniref:FtsW/RodA/SpoVE family cell cycle protein n=1 Tax=Helicobacter heilmannii TaxID=35817 RepID=UPI0006A13FBC|nr:FtsW/RodA/SpoVE family cell cycle protein [Helicobacter heilmannii]CRF50595.1 Rod shape-determining protein RodA [Helicobacter heilmannii]
MVNRKILTHFDFLLLFFVVPLMGLSFFLIYEANTALSFKQILYFSVGFVVFWMIFFIPFRQLDRIFHFFYWFCVFLLVLVIFFGSVKLGAKRWLTIPGTSLSLQPSEPVKIAILLLLAHLISTHPIPPGGYGWKIFGKLALYITIPAALILKQPDLGTALVVLIMGFGVLFLVGVHPKIWITIGLVFAVASPLIYSSLHDYQKKRLHDFIAEKPNYHVRQSIIAIGSGGLLGKSKEESTQAKLKFLPIATSDFIFAYFVERFGFLGAFFLLVFYMGFILHFLSYFNSDPHDRFLQTITGGIAILLFVYTSVNVAMTLGLAPVVGLPLPLFSYGGSSFITFIILFAVFENLLAFKFGFGYNPPSYRKGGFLAQLVRAFGS